MQAFADIATIAVIHVTGPRERDLASLAHVALAARAVIEQAKGVIAAQAGLGMAAAFDRLRASADGSGVPLAAFARQTIDNAQPPGAGIAALPGGQGGTGTATLTTTTRAYGQAGRAPYRTSTSNWSISAAG